SWKGGTGAGYEAYDRTHQVTAPPAEQRLTLSSDPAFHGDPALLNPEQLLVMAAASCQMLSFLAIAARKRIEVVEYADTAEGFMAEDDKPVRITRIILKPRISIIGDVDKQQVGRMLELAHQQCFIANSLRSDIEIRADIHIQPR
ncbi:MAG: OsmC family protein, partial [Gammaproteobacteria bacterium]|nr:OsmC family protein [Gammaproteobacteria bacterium]